jgi:hypothetical protein
LAATERTWSVTTQNFTTGVAVVASKILGAEGAAPPHGVSAALLLVGVAYFTREKVRQSSEDQVQAQLRVVLDSDVLAVETRIDAWKLETNIWAENPAVRNQAERQINEAGGDRERAPNLGGTSEMKAFTALFAPFLKEPGYVEVALTDREGIRMGTGRRDNARAAAFAIPILARQTCPWRIGKLV